MKKILIPFVIGFIAQNLSAQTKTFSYNMVQITKNMNVTELATRKTKIIVNKTRSTISVIDSEFPTPYVFKIDGYCDITTPSINCMIRDKQNKLNFFSYNKNRLEIMNLTGDGTRYINIKP